MNTWVWFSAGLLVLGQAAPDNEAELKDVLFPFYGSEAVAYDFFLDEKHDQRLQLQKQPVMTWTNADKYMGQGNRGSATHLDRVKGDGTETAQPRRMVPVIPTRHGSTPATWRGK